jgi:hypothetical protein
MGHHRDLPAIMQHGERLAVLLRRLDATREKRAALEASMERGASADAEKSSLAAVRREERAAHRAVLRAVAEWRRES